MKKLFMLWFFAIPVAMVISSCTIENVEPRYDERDRLVGYYEVEEYSDTYHDYTYYSMRISKASYYNEIYLHNFYAANIRVYAIVEYDRIRIPFQVVEGYEIEGTGTAYGSEINLSYRVKDRWNNAYTDFCDTRAWLE